MSKAETNARIERELALAGIANRTFARLSTPDKMRMERRYAECAIEMSMRDYLIRHISDMLAMMRLDPAHAEYIANVKEELFDIYRTLTEEHKAVIRKRKRGVELTNYIVLFPEDLIDIKQRTCSIYGSNQQTGNEV